MSNGLRSKLYLCIETMILFMLSFCYLHPNIDDRNALFPFVFNSYTWDIWWSVQHCYFLSWLSRKPLCIRYILFLTPCKLWGYGYTLSTGTPFSFIPFFYLIIGFWLFSSLLKFKVASIVSSMIWVTVDIVSFSLFYLQQGQELSRIFLFKIQNGELLDWEGFQYFMQLTLCRKLPTVFLLEKSSLLFAISKTFKK